MNKIYFLTVITISVLIFSSCTRKMKYIYKEEKLSDSIHVYNVKSEKYKLKSYDVLNIKIVTTEPKINELFEINGQKNNSNQSESSLYLSGFSVNDSGYVQIPIIGTLKAAGKTVTQFRSELTKKTHEFLKEAIVNVKLVSFKISFLGEVNNKGPVYIYQDNIDVLEAVSRAGGVTDYADMKNVTVIRNSQNKRLVYKLDLTRRELLTSEKFYLYPNDIIIVDPVKSKIARINFQDYFFFFSALSSALSTTALILSIVRNN